MLYEIRSRALGRVAAEGEGLIVAFDYPVEGARRRCRSRCASGSRRSKARGSRDERAAAPGRRRRRHPRRFARVGTDGQLAPRSAWPSSEFGDLASAVRRALELLARGDPASAAGAEAAIAVAGPVTGDRVELTNVAWRFSIEESRVRLASRDWRSVNDIAALAWALPVLGRPGDALPGRGRTRSVGRAHRGRGGHRPRRGDPGRGRRRGGRAALGGGHRDLAASGAREWQVVEWLAARFGGTSRPSGCSPGPGSPRCTRARGARRRRAALPAEQVGPRALAGEPRAREAMTLFAGWLGAFAGDSP